MLDMYLMYQLARRPLHAMARHWMCRGLKRATAGAVVCIGCGD